MITVKPANGKGHFWQWDTGQELLVEGAPEVHFGRPDESTTVNVAVVNGIAKVPDALLQAPGALQVYAYDTDHTLSRCIIDVVRRQKPDGYVTTPEAVTPEPVSVANILVDAFSVDGVDYDAVGYEEGKRLSTSSGVTKDAAGVVTSGYIPFKAGAVIRIKPVQATTTGNPELAAAFYDANKGYLAADYIHLPNGSFGTAENETNTITKMTLVSNSTYKFFRICVPAASGAELIVTYDHAIVGG